jgi:hypothetical protein
MLMKKSRELSDLLFDSPAKVLQIKDREELLSIYDEYLQQHFIETCNRITKYDDNVCKFFVDLLIFLKDKYRSEEYKHQIYSHIWDLYHEELTIRL